ncbi:hypothetical protein ACQPTN_32915 [Bradyrhizobium sp. 13971]
MTCLDRRHPSARGEATVAIGAAMSANRPYRRAVAATWRGAGELLQDDLELLILGPAPPPAVSNMRRAEGTIRCERIKRLDETDPRRS